MPSRCGEGGLFWSVDHGRDEAAKIFGAMRGRRLVPPGPRGRRQCREQSKRQQQFGSCL